MSSHDALLIEDEKSRQQALEIDSFIVEAPAGAGKTELLTQRFLKLLQTVQAPEEIIAITFTNKAASEMKSRILDSLQDAADQVPVDKTHKRQTRELALAALQCAEDLRWNLLQTPSRLRIYTIDSLCSNLARQMPLLSRFGSQPGVCDDATVYYQDAATRALENIDDPEMGPVVQDALRYFDNDGYRLTQLLAEMLAKRDQWLVYTQGQNAAEVAEAALAHILAQDIEAAAKYLNPVIQQLLMPVARYAASNLTDESSIFALQDWSAELTVDVSQLQLWQALTEILLTGTGGFRKRLDKNMGLPATEEAKPYKESLAAVIDTLRDMPGAEQTIARLALLPQSGHDDATWQMIATLSKLLNMAVAELWLVFQAHGEVDFVEISQRSLLALEDDGGNPTDLALKLDYSIRHLLVDEFQDTSPGQIKLLRALTQGWMPGDGRTLFAVGDPMQSIYRFRKANVGLFLRVAQEGIGQVALKSLKLWRNNRSCPPVVEWVNQAFMQMFPREDSVARGAIRYRPFVATRQGEKDAGVYVHALLDDMRSGEAEEDEVTLNDVRQQEAIRIISIIQQTWAQDPARKIAVLVRARSHLRGLVTEIRRNHPELSFQAVEIEELASRQIVQDLLSLTNALYQRADRVHWLAILRAPWCGLTLADLHALVGHDKYSSVFSLMNDENRLQLLTEDGRQRMLHVRDVMAEALAHRGRLSASRWVHGVWLMLGGADCLWDAGDVRDVQAFFARMDQLEACGQFSTEQLALEVQKLYAAPDAKAPDRLQFMTIHKSKGLEFDTVILPGLDRKTGGGEQPLLLWEEVPRQMPSHDATEMDLVVAPLIPKGKNIAKQVTPYDYLKLLEIERARQEDARVLYVAATRAERCLHLLGAARLDARTGETKAPRNTFLEMLWPIIQTQFHEGNVQKKNVLSQLASTMALQDFVPQLVRLGRPEIPAILRGRSLPVPVSSSKAGASSQENSADGFDADIGILAHRYVEIIANQSTADWSANRVAALKPNMQHWLVRRGYEAGKAAHGAERVIEVLQTTLTSAQGRWVLEYRAGAQSELKIASIDQQAVSIQIIDRTFVDNGVRWIIDYKSTQLSASLEEAVLKSMAEQYRPQLEGYAALFSNEDFPIRTAVFFLALGKLIELS